MVNYQSILEAQNRIQGHIKCTPIVSSSLLNQWLGHTILFKAECLQKIGAFKARGGCNAVASLVEKGQKDPALTPKKVVANSSGNHAQAVAWAARQYQIPATIYMPSSVSKVKAQATASYGAQTVFADHRADVDAQVEAASHEPGTYWVPPYDHDDVIAGQGTAVAEVLQSGEQFDAIFTPCGGGGLISGSLVVSRHFSNSTQVFAVEPRLGNDALRSRKTGVIQKLSNAPDTLADGARTLSISERTFHFIKQLDGFYDVEEADIIYWTQWLTHLLKLSIEPTSAMCMDAVMQWLRTQSSPRRILVVLSGGNLDHGTRQKIWYEDQLSILPMEKFG